MNERQPSSSRGWIEITPRGVRYPAANLDHVVDRARRYGAQIVYLTRLAILDKTYGRTLGKLWIVLDPVLQSVVFFVILSIIFNVNGTDVSFLSIYLLVNVWRLNGTLFNLAPSLIAGYGSVLQQTNFPLEIVVLVQVLNQLFLFSINFGIVLILMFLGKIYPTPVWVCLPLVLLTHLAFSMTVVLVFSLFGVVVRDFTQMAPVLTQLWFYGSPVVYGMERIPEPARTLMEWINPFVTIIPAYRHVLIEGKVPAISSLLLILLGSLIALYVMSKYLDQARHRLYQYL